MVVNDKLQNVLDKMEYLDPCQSGFRPEYRTEIALIAQMNYFCLDLRDCSLSLPIFLDLLAAFNIH